MPLQGCLCSLQGRACVQTHFCDELLSQRGGCEDSLSIVRTCRCEHHIQYIHPFIRRWVRRNVRCSYPLNTKKESVSLETGSSYKLLWEHSLRHTV
jgi:hypothetical protein